MSRKFALIAVLMLTVALYPGLNSLFAQEDKPIVELGTYEIRADPERPTVVTTPDRQKPDIDIGELKRPDEGKIFNTSSAIKPRLADIEVKKIEKPKKMLAKTRK
jgi:hypothetical protein